MIPGTSDSLYKEVGHLGRQGQGTGIAHSSKPCEASSDPRQYAMEVCQRRLPQEGVYNGGSYPSCGGEVTRPTHTHTTHHEQRAVYEDYSRMGVYTEDGSGRGWEGMGGCGTSRSAAAPNHTAHPYTYSYTDCRLDTAWNKCVAGMGIGGPMGGASGENFPSQEHQVESSQVKTTARGPASHTLAVNVNMGMTSGDPSMSRSHYDYQPLPGAQIPPFLPYLTPLNYQQVTDVVDRRVETRTDHRAVNRSDVQVGGCCFLELLHLMNTAYSIFKIYTDPNYRKILLLYPQSNGNISIKLYICDPYEIFPLMIVLGLCWTRDLNKFPAARADCGFCREACGPLSATFRQCCTTNVPPSACTPKKCQQSCQYISQQPQHTPGVSWADQKHCGGPGSGILKA